MRTFGFLVSLVIGALVVSTVSAGAPSYSLRPVLRPLAAVLDSQKPVEIAASTKGLQRWIKRYKSRALKAGISAAVLDQAFRGVQYNAAIIKKDRNQNEFTKTIWDYLDSAASDARIRNGKAALSKHNATLQKIEKRYGVDKEVVVAIWGLESAYGTFKGSTPVIEALATLAYDGRRGDFFEEQLTAALSIVQSGDVSPQNMTGSWAGAMGHTQFMPTSYLSHAVDFTGDGKRDIWSGDPTDALASTAAYLKHFGWKKNQPWGVEIKLPKGFDYASANRENLKNPSEWARLGIKDMRGRPVPNHGPASILLPAGAQGAAFMIFKNFDVIEHYNTADAYVIGVGHLADRIQGGPAIQGNWPRGDRALTYKERIELQKRLTKAGFDTQKIDGKIGPLTIASVRGYQRSKGMIPDGYASLTLLKSLR
ncbi:lytic murein transglycosylase [Shimia sagamensis]|uniref:Lytic murein transglycosylase n=1 Tax=Shimia sagamensis TaxID=1566352 RepID=A0ABY1NDU8_9RHOB|nr:lytic murein transglycosylase [Shimia sagamensis]SMP07262.1 lytic murein transglycosylase [Shimia sagamensis]